MAILVHPGGVEINLILNSKDPEPHNVLMDTGEKHAGYTHVALKITDIESAKALENRGRKWSGPTRCEPTPRTILLSASVSCVLR